MCILASSILLAVDDVYLKNDSDARTIITNLDYFFTVAFLVEMILKWLGIGIKNYFTDLWSFLDFCIVMVKRIKELIYYYIRLLNLFRFHLLM